MSQADKYFGFDLFERKSLAALVAWREGNGEAPTVASVAGTQPELTQPVTFVSGTNAIVTLTVPERIKKEGGSVTLIPTGVFTWTAAGNIALAGTAVVGKALTMTWVPVTGKWYPSYIA